MITFDRSRRLPASQVMGRAETGKDSLVLHYTGGTTVEGAFNHWLMSPERVGTALIVGLDGRVSEVFPMDHWAFHLGLGPLAEFGRHDKRSIGIEVVNVGQLRRVGDTLMWWPNNYRTPFCSIRDVDRYVQVKAWRGFQYFASFTPQQLAVIPELVDHCCKQFSIPKTFLPSLTELNLDAAKKHKGISTHSNWLLEKLDIGPAFPWKILGA